MEEPHMQQMADLQLNNGSVDSHIEDSGMEHSSADHMGTLEAEVTTRQYPDQSADAVHPLPELSDGLLEIDGQSVVIGAGMLQPAPAVEELPPAGHEGSLSFPTPALEAFQLGPHALKGMQGPAGLVSDEGIGKFPLQRQAKIQENFLHIQFSNDATSKLQNSNVDYGTTKRQTHYLPSQKDPIIGSFKDNLDGQTAEVEGEMLKGNLALDNHILLNSSQIDVHTESHLCQNVSSKDNTPIQCGSDKGIERKSELHPQKLYSRVAAPPNATPLTAGASPECGISIERVQGLSLETYAWAATQVTGKDTITYIGHNPADDNFVLIFLKTQELAALLVESGLWIRGKWLNVSFFQAPATKYIVSGILPFIPDSLIIEALSHYGTSVYSVLRRIPAAVRSSIFKGLLSFRREIYIVKNENPMPNTISVSFLGVNYPLVISDRGPRCFHCGSLSHLAIKCSIKENKQIAMIEGGAGTIVEDVTGVQQQKGNNIQDVGNQEQEWESWKGTAETHKTLASVKGDRHHQNANDEQKRAPADGKVPSKLMNKQKIEHIKSKLVSRTENSENCKDKAVEQKKEQPTQENHSLNISKDTLIGPRGFILKKGSEQFKSIEGCQKDKDITRQDGGSNSGPKMHHMSTIQTIKTSSLYNCLVDEMTASDSDSSLMEEGSGKSKKKKKKDNRQQNHPGALVEQSSMEIEESNEKVQDEMNTFEHQLDKVQTHSSSVMLKKAQHKSSHANIFVFKGSGHEELVSDSDKEKALQVAKLWCDRARNLRANPRRKLAITFVDNYPDLQALLSLALADSQQYPPASARYRKVQELLDRSKGILEKKKKIYRAPKRRQQHSP